MSHKHNEDGEMAVAFRLRSSAQIILEGSFLSALDVMGVLGNLMVCLVVYQRRNFKRVANIYVVALALSDILMGTVCEPLSCAFLFTGHWTFGKTACRLQGCLSFFAAFFSLQTMTAMAVNRYFRVVKPLLYRKLFSVRRTLISLVIIACTSLFGAGISSAVGLSDFAMDYGKSFCFIDFPTRHGEMAFIVMMHTFYITIPLSVVSVCYYKIFRKVRVHTKETFQKENSGQGKSGSRRHRSKSIINKVNVEEVRITKVLFATVLGFSICWTPIALIDLIDVFSNHTIHMPRQVLLLYAFLGYGSSSINPFIYGIINREFRQDFLNVFYMGCRTTRVHARGRRQRHRHSNKIKSDSGSKNAEAHV